MSVLQCSGRNSVSRPAEYLHGGDIYGNDSIRLDFSVNTNPLGMPEAVRAAVAAHPEDWTRYPDIYQRELREALARFYAESCENFICGNGACDLLYSLLFALRPGRALLFAPCFGEYEAALRAVCCEVRTVSLREEEDFCLTSRDIEEALSGIDMLILGNPGNPTGQTLKREELETVAALCKRQGTFLVVDECFQWFLEEPAPYSGLPLLKTHENVFLLNAFTKIFCMAGLRLGYGICKNRQVLERMRLCRQPWSVSGPAARAGIEALKETEFVEKTRRFIAAEREFLTEGLKSLGCRVCPSEVNYLLFRGPKGKDLFSFCRDRGILIRSCKTFGLDERYYRIAVRGRQENEELLACLACAVREL